MTTKTIVIGCDNAAVGLKQELIKVMEQEGVAYEDVGGDGYKRSDLLSSCC